MLPGREGRQHAKHLKTRAVRSVVDNVTMACYACPAPTASACRISRRQINEQPIVPLHRSKAQIFLDKLRGRHTA